MDEFYFNVLTDKKRSVGERYLAINHLKNIGTQNSLQLLMKAYQSTEGSVLLTHEILYSLGQVDESFYSLVKDFLINKASDQNQSPVARHQATQSLANYFTKIPDIQQFFQKYLHCGIPQLQDTCRISIQKSRRPDLIDHYNKQIVGTKQPAAPFTEQEFEEFLQEKKLKGFFMNMGFLGLLLKPESEVNLFEKYRIMYYMRNIGGRREIKTFCDLLSKKYFRNLSSLMKHQMCFILGQIGCDQFQDEIKECMENEEQAEIVRHEALAAVASHGKDINYLKKFTNHENKLIRESAQVAEWIIKYYVD